jgi:pimeloyl-ACP methyl ester carboxylesterase
MSQLANAYALIIGIGKDLPASVHDAQAIYDLLADKEIAGYNPENITLLTEKDATNTRILEAFDELVEKVDQDASVFLFYSGHGGTYTDNDIIELEHPEGTPLKPEEENQSHYYLVPNNFDLKNYRDTWVHADVLKEKINQLKSRRLIFFFDCCHAEGMTKAGPELKAKSGSLKDRLQNPEGLVHRMDDGKGYSIVSSCRAEELSWILGDDPNSLFTTCLLEVLRGEHRREFEDPYIRMTEVVRHIMKRVPERKPVQRPFVNLQLYDDFVLSCLPENLMSRLREAATVSQQSTEDDIKKEVVTRFREDGAPNLLLFVHGFSGEAADTFGSIPEMLMENPAMNGWDLMPLGYSEHVNPEMGKTVWASEGDIDRISDYLQSALRHKFTNYKRIALVGHSLGGLVVQDALSDLEPQHLKRISHVLLFATPSNGISSASLKKLCDADSSALQREGHYIKTLREAWNAKFGEELPFELRTVAATNDEFVPVESSLEPFPEASRVTLEGNHYGLVKPKGQENDTYQLILQTLTGNEFHSKFTDPEEVNIALGNYDEVIKDLWPKRDGLNLKGLRNLIFALEGMDRQEEALSLLETHPLAQKNSDLMGIMGGRHKRKYLQTLEGAHGQKAIEYYEKGLALAEAADNKGQIYYLSINLAFLSLVYDEDHQSMQEYALQALEAAQADAFDSLWKLATLGEANLYLGKLDASKEHYERAAKMAGIREKISIHTNAYAAYTSLMHSESQDDPFIVFLKSHFLS